MIASPTKVRGSVRRSWETFVRVVATLLVVALTSWHVLPAPSPGPAPGSVPVMTAMCLAVAAADEARSGEEQSDIPEEGHAADADGDSQSESEPETEDEERAETMEALLVASTSPGRSAVRAAFYPRSDRSPDEASLEVASPPPEA